MDPGRFDLAVVARAGRGRPLIPAQAAPRVVGHDARHEAPTGDPAYVARALRTHRLTSLSSGSSMSPGVGTRSRPAFVARRSWSFDPHAGHGPGTAVVCRSIPQESQRTRNRRGVSRATGPTP